MEMLAVLKTPQLVAINIRYGTQAIVIITTFKGKTHIPNNYFLA